jgi:hypothetical protein
VLVALPESLPSAVNGQGAIKSIGQHVEVLPEFFVQVLLLLFSFFSCFFSLGVLEGFFLSLFRISFDFDILPPFFVVIVVIF